MTTKKIARLKVNPWDDYYFLTITLSEKNDYGIGPVAQFHNTYRRIYELLNELCDYIRLRPELTENGILHYHAIYRCKGFKEYIKMYKTRLPYYKHKYGFIKNVAVRNFDNVTEYINKRNDFMDEVLDHPEILSKDPLDKYEDIEIEVADAIHTTRVDPTIIIL